MDEIVKTLITETDFLKNATDEPSKEIGEQLANMINLIFTPLQIARIYKDIKLQAFLEKVKNKYLNIPVEELTSPPLNILGPALEASKYYYDQDELRDMFANLVASLCDKRISGIIHPAYVEVLKQITPLEAQLLSAFRPKSGFSIHFSVGMYPNNELMKQVNSLDEPESSYYTFPETIMPVVNYWFANETTRILIQNHVLINEICDDFTLISASVVNLQRLGLLEISYTNKLNDTEYNTFLTNQKYLDWHDNLILNKDKKVTLQFIRGHMVIPGQYNRIDIEKGTARLTQFGFNFIDTCVIKSRIIPNL